MRHLGDPISRRVARPLGWYLPRGGLLPYSINFSDIPDGPLPAPWVGATFAISGGVAVNTPTLGVELLTDPGLEANYTAGKCDTLTLNGTPTLSQSGDAHEGSKAQQFACTVVNQWVRFPQVAAVQGTWYLISGWEKLTVGAVSLDFRMVFVQAAGFPSGGAGSAGLINDAAYTKKTSSFLTNSTANISIFAVNAFATGRTGIVDDFSLKAITYSTLYAMIDSRVDRLATTMIQPDTIADNTITSVICWADAATSPNTYVMASINERYSETGLEIGLMKVVGGVPTQLINPTFAVAVVDAWVEIRPTDDDTVGLYYNNVQIGADQDIADVPGEYVGFFISGGNNLKSFFVG